MSSAQRGNLAVREPESDDFTVETLIFARHDPRTSEQRRLDGKVPLRLDTAQRIARLRDEASALCSEVRDLERLMPFPVEHVCIDCEVGQLEAGAGG